MNSTTFFLTKEDTCGWPFEDIEDISLFKTNPPYIEVENVLEAGEFYVENIQVFDYVPEPYDYATKGPDMRISAGYWKIKYKNL